MTDLGEFEIHFGNDDERRRFEEWWDSHAGQGCCQQHPSGYSQGSPTAGMTLEIIEQRLVEAEAEIERLEQSIKFHLGEARRLTDHYDWLAGHFAKLAAERLRMEAEGRAVVGDVEEMLRL